MPVIGQPVQASAKRISFDRSTPQKLKDESWQERAWNVYDQLGSIYYMTRYRSAVARKVEYYVATVDTPGNDPDVDVITNSDGEVTGLGDGSKVLDTEGGPELLRRLVSELMVHWDVPGEAYVVRFEEEPFWRVLSTQELKAGGKAGSKYQWLDDGVKKDTIDSDNVFRVWKPHPRNHWQADSPTKHVLEDAEELILLGREIKARSQSRLPAGVWMIPDTVDLSPFAADEEGDEDDFARELTRRLSRPIKDPGSADSLVPWVITMDKADIEAASKGFLRFDRDFEITVDHRQELLRAIATGLDVPPEILTGMADLNHWSAWLVSEQAIDQHVAPSVDDILDSLTGNWFRPLLMASSVDPDGYVLWRDLSPASMAPDRSDLAVRLFEAGVISDVATRRVSDFDEEDAPEVIEGQVVMDADELQKRINALGVLRRAGADWEDSVRAVGLPPIELIPGLLPITVRSEEEVEARGEAVTAAVGTVEANELARIDSDLLAWTVEASGNEIDRLLQRPDEVRDNSEAQWLLLLAAFSLRLDKRIASAQAKARDWIERLTGLPIVNPLEQANREAGVAAILAGIVEAVEGSLFTPGAKPDPIDLGEVLDRPVPVAAIRAGLSLAGGGESFAQGVRAWELVANGHDNVLTLEQRGYRTLSYRWDYGLAPRDEFPPHKALNGREFDSWESSVLTVNADDAWLKRPFYSPGDHRGCLCSYTRILTISLPLPVAASV